MAANESCLKKSKLTTNKPLCERKTEIFPFARMNAKCIKSGKLE